jgi:hypothetical protein
MAWQPNIDAGQAIDPPRLKFSNRISRHLIQQSLEYQELIVGTNRLRNLRIEGPFIQAVVNSLNITSEGYSRLSTVRVRFS